MTTETTLAGRVASLHQARLNVTNAKAVIDNARAEWAEQWAPELANLEAATTNVATLEVLIRGEAVTTYKETGETHPAPGIGIRVTHRLSYDPTVALSWAKEHGLALKLDSGAFDAIAKAQTLDCVTYVDEPTATIAKDLGRDAIE